MTKQRHHALQTTAFAISLALPCAALAQPPGADWEEPVPAPAEAEYDTVTKHYGIQILATDAAVIVAGFATEEPNVLLGGYLLGGPIVHLFNGKKRTALGSLAMRAGFPLMGGVLGAAAAESDCRDDDEEEMFCGLGHVVGGMLLGMITAAVVDAAVLAKKTTRERRAPAAIRYGSLTANPDLRVTKKGSVTFGFTGRF